MGKDANLKFGMRVLSKVPTMTPEKNWRKGGVVRVT